MSESVRDLLMRGIAAAKAGDKDEARFFLQWVLRMEASEDQEWDAWYYLSKVTDNPVEKRDYVENILARNPRDPAARRELAILDGQLDPSQIVDPDRMPRAESETPQAADARRFVCSQCGARMVFAPDGQSLVCEYCGSRRAIPSADAAGLEERDLLLTLASAQGHTRPVAQQVVACQGCGASFVLPPETLSLTCPFCGSAHAVRQTESRDLIAPDGIIPFAVTQDQAWERILQWLRTAGLDGCAPETPAGVYLPVWVFNVGGEVGWHGEARKQGMIDHPLSGREPVLQSGVLIPASRKLPRGLADVMETFRLDGLIAYDARYLADWPAETYEISVSDASLEARRKSLTQARAEIVNLVEADIVPDSVTLNSIGLAVESFRLILVPMWSSRYTAEDRRFAVVVNGQTGDVRGERPLRGIRKWLTDLLGEED